MRGSSRTTPCSAEVTVRAPGFCTPRRDMHRCSASSTTPTPCGRELGLEPAGDLRREALLHLQEAGEVLHHAGQLGQPDDAVAGQVADVRDARERQEVVLAERVERDPARHDELVVAAVVRERRRREGRRRQQLGVHARHAARRVAPALVASRSTPSASSSAGPPARRPPGRCRRPRAPADGSSVRWSRRICAAARVVLTASAARWARTRSKRAGGDARLAVARGRTG